jgi:hypothetical protein
MAVDLVLRVDRVVVARESSYGGCDFSETLAKLGLQTREGVVAVRTADLLGTEAPAQTLRDNVGELRFRRESNVTI